MSNMSNQKIGITGTIGSGKSSVTHLIAKQYPTISADDIVSDFYCDKSFIRSVNKLIYNRVSDEIDKGELAHTIFNNIDLKRKLEQFIHPLVKEEIYIFLNKHEGLVFVEVPLLFEAEFEDIFDCVIVVVADEELIIKRLVETRNYTEEDAIIRISNQLSVEEKIRRADYVIKNNDTTDALEHEVNELIEILKKGD